ncbi:MAG: tripartite tricarboxylate transporter substrate binding protein [Betaproteobacteria bacterium]|nr:tripartite tricarboxylate transporter substrate binding protein [Betaproteobacteria bacterium]
MRPPSLLLLAVLMHAAATCAQTNPPAEHPVRATPPAEYPVRALRLVLPFPPGGGTDTLGRIVTQTLSDALGQPVIAENRPGAGGNIGNEAVAHAAPDGYTLLLGSPGLAISPSLYRRLNYDPLRDLTAVALVADIPNLLAVRRSVPARSVKELVQLARAQPGKLAFGTGGPGTSNELGAHLFLTATRLRILIVPHRGVNQATVALLGGHVDMVIAGVATVAPHIREQKLRGLAVLGPTRVAVLPDVPTATEAGYPWLQVRTWYIVMAPEGTSRSIIERLNAALTASAQSSEIRGRLRKLGFEPLTSTPAQAAQFLAAETERWGKVVAASGARVE